MSMNYPNYVQHMLARARTEGQWYAGQSDAASLCFDVLALFPDHDEAAALVYDLFCDEWLLYDNRNAIQQHIDEWDDRPWQQRRRLALSFRFMSRWEGWHREYEPDYVHERTDPPDVREVLEEGKGMLLHAYCLGDEACSDLAWPLFVDAFARTNDPRTAMLWVGKLYADMGFFADSAEVLVTLCSRFDDPYARRLLAEVCWWRDNGHRVPWLPPPGDGSRYRRMIDSIDPDAPDDEAMIRELRAHAGMTAQPIWTPIASSDLAALLAAPLSTIPEPSVPPLVDWSFLDEDDGQPGELPAWAQQMVAMFPPAMAEDIVRRHRWSRPIKPPTTPPRRDPAEPPFDPDEFFDGDDEEDGV